jgi:hypothetical protein
MCTSGGRSACPTAAARVVEDDDAVPTLHERANHLAVQVSPARLAVKAHHRRAVAWPCIEVVHPQPVDVEVVRCEVVSG